MQSKINMPEGRQIPTLLVTSSESATPSLNLDRRNDSPPPENSDNDTLSITIHNASRSSSVAFLDGSFTNLPVLPEDRFGIFYNITDILLVLYATVVVISLCVVISLVILAIIRIFSIEESYESSIRRRFRDGYLF